MYSVLFVLTTMSPHNIKAILKMRNEMLKALEGSTWGMGKKTIITTNKAIERSILN